MFTASTILKSQRPSTFTTKHHDDEYVLRICAIFGPEVPGTALPETVLAKTPTTSLIKPPMASAFRAALRSRRCLGTNSQKSVS
jgi:hypothetical protein